MRSHQSSDGGDVLVENSNRLMHRALDGAPHRPSGSPAAL
jgi:hypothetical protein